MKTNNEFQMFIKKSELCKAAHLMSKDVELVAIINKNGRIVESKIKEDTGLSCLSDSQLEMIAMQRALQTSMIKEFDQDLSPFHQTIAIRESHAEFVCRLDEGVLLVITNADADVKQLSANMSSLISAYQTSACSAVVS